MRYFLLAVAMAGLAIPACKRSMAPLSEPRDFTKLTWQADTLFEPEMHDSQVMMESIWGSSTQDIYTVGHSSGLSDMWYYDGTSWQLVDLYSYGITIGLDGEVFGFSADNVWAVGNKPMRNSNPPPDYVFYSVIIHYDGTKWEYSLKDTSGRMLNSVWGAAPDDIWAGGEYHTLYHYDGVQWKREYLYYDFPPNDHISITFIGGRPGLGAYIIVLLYPATEDQSYRFYLFKYVNTSWRLVPGVNTYRTLAGIWASPSGKAYFGGYGLNKLDGGEFKNIYGPISVTSVYGLD
ncbi:MAG TPA: hypothetical protein ENJ89_01685, partial [Caldithrix abyssi]|nr:hypothetical protein [Caldithrix abyssi]